jgi:hypothetical protein
MADKTCKVCGRPIPDGHVCLSCGDYDDQQRFVPDALPKVRTNGDRIRAMNDADLAQFLFQMNTCKTCPFSALQCKIGEWLKKEAQSE